MERPRASRKPPGAARRVFCGTPLEPQSSGDSAQPPEASPEAPPGFLVGPRRSLHIRHPSWPPSWPLPS
ncbi:hypothetical protein NDU88_002095 [Pleurodeles waltl]|uniref:Uncharacterized protein n=1 Tax=Pleurodeles waltl TaxID=8319 RepID=A0AAV7LBC8_PLEWA|nr:hypothetical protein NDU88_002095 [Pleurodeles waltl]